MNKNYMALIYIYIHDISDMFEIYPYKNPVYYIYIHIKDINPYIRYFCIWLCLKIGHSNPRLGRFLGEEFRGSLQRLRDGTHRLLINGIDGGLIGKSSTKMEILILNDIDIKWL
jgi:hypothetical protein